MNDASHIDQYIQDYLDGDLSPAAAERVEAHLRACRRCSEEVRSMRSVMNSVRELPAQIAPPNGVWSGIAANISTGTPVTAGATYAGGRASKREDRAASGKSKRLLVVAVATAATVAVVTWAIMVLSTGSWAVERISGTPRVAEADVVTREALRIGEWLTTDASSRARLRAGVIGDVDVQPNTRLQLRQTRLNDHRIALESGRIEARIWAPPRLFIVETPAATAIDLGCVYTLTVDGSGRSVLSVKSGYVELKRDGRSSVVPAGATCIARRESGPGTAFASDAPPRFREALERYDFAGAAPEDLAVVLREARPEDAVTLWQIVERSDGETREKVYERLTDLVPPPSGVEREAILAGKPESLKIWRMHLGLEALSWWGYVWRKLASWKDG